MTEMRELYSNITDRSRRRIFCAIFLRFGWAITASLILGACEFDDGEKSLMPGLEGAVVGNSSCGNDFDAHYIELINSNRFSAYDGRSKVARRIDGIAKSIAARSELQELKCEAVYWRRPVESHMIPIRFDFRADGSEFCINEDSGNYWAGSSDTDVYPWVERWAGAIEEAPGRAVKFLSMCYSISGKFLRYGK